MRQTILAVYDSYPDAHSAQRALGEAGVAQADIAIYSMSADAPAEKGPRVYAPGSGPIRRPKPVFDQLEQLFVRLFKSNEYPPEAEDYREFIRRGGTLVSADVAEMEVDRVLELMRSAGAADIEERASAWRHGSMKPDMREDPLQRASLASQEYASRYESPTGRRDDTLKQSGGVAGIAPSSGTTDEAAVARGTTPGQATHAAAAGSASPSGGARLQSSRFSSTGSKPIAGMQKAATHTEGRGSNPTMENQQRPSSASNAGVTRTFVGGDAGLKARTGYSPDDATNAAKGERRPNTGLAGDRVTGTPLNDDPDDNEFRRDYDAHYANTGAPYDEYRRAYTHGATLGQDERYRGFDWQQVEPNAREDWESRYPDSGWERFKAAVRHGWERVIRR